MLGVFSKRVQLPSPRDRSDPLEFRGFGSQAVSLRTGVDEFMRCLCGGSLGSTLSAISAKAGKVKE